MNDVVAKCVSRLIKKQSCIGYSKRRKCRPKMRQNAFDGRAPPGPAGGASAIGADSTGAIGNVAPVLTQEPGQTLRFAPVLFMAVL